MNSPKPLQLYIGIDTGGTFTDGVLLNPETHEVLFSAKTPTTHMNLRECVHEIIGQLVAEALKLEAQIRLVSLSTTLATNAIAEGKQRPNLLFLIGYDRELVERFQLQHELGTDRYCYIAGGANLEGEEVTLLDTAAILRQIEKAEGVEAYAVSSYGGPVNSRQEEAAAELIAAKTAKPVVQGNQLSTRMGSIQRAATASINASLLIPAFEFVTAVAEDLRNRDLDCPLIIVRGDGSLAEASFAMDRPVEIIHSGPATSTIGGRFLAGVQDALVIDVGGTTTDIGLAEGGQIRLKEDGALVGGVHTWVNTIQARSFGLGGDSLIHFSGREGLKIGPERAIPLSRLAAEYPQVREDLQRTVLAAGEIHRSSQLEYWVLRRLPNPMPADARTRRVIELLANGPRRMTALLKEMKTPSPLLVDANWLVQHEIIDRANLTPTDLMHAQGFFQRWDNSLSQMIIDAVQQYRQTDFIDECRRWIAAKLFAEVLEFVTGVKSPDILTPMISSKDMGRWILRHCLKPNGILRPMLHLDIPLVGIGAPAGWFLKDLAGLLNTELILPKFYEVANAVGTVVADVRVRHEGEVSPVLNGPVVIGFSGRAAGKRQVFEDRSEAVEFVRLTLAELALSEARAAGSAAPQLSWVEEDLGADMARIAVTAGGHPAAA